MTTRLVLACGSFGHSLYDDLGDLPGELLVVTDEESRVEALREESIPATRGDCGDPETIRAVVDEDDRPVETVVVAGTDAATNRRAVAAAREAYPDAMLLAYVPAETDGETRDAIEAVADRVVDPETVLARRILEPTRREGLRVRQLRRLLREMEGPLAVVMHDNPDPDAIASAVALCAIAETAGCDAEAIYYGDITHQENLALVNLLEFDLKNLEPGDDLSAYGGFALVDHSRPGVNDQLPEDTAVDVVIDHHPPREPVAARFVDLRSDVGATSTLLVDYLRLLGVRPSTEVATGLLYGIRVDTKEFSREVSTDDFEAAAYLLPYVDQATLERVESPSVSVDILETIGRAIRNRRTEGSVLTSCVGRLRSRDALAQAADRLLDMEDVTTTLVYGIQDGTIYASARTRGADLDVGETLREAFSPIGEAGGHADMAGAQIPLGLLGSVEEDSDEELRGIIEDVITDRFFETLRSRPHWDLTERFDDGVEGLPAGTGTPDDERG
ncbi:DHH family phosphoesterase [Halomarina pelagica]|uniref:DHH family phosphoesterase n=1 Tax=Halomarina pelagica TaxID=2961599 RepID=UPI0020C4678C|nr:bifunctional oligoribonuclease/PAP phosphatase NrnA [Halomarina sp. BND7]